MEEVDELAASTDRLLICCMCKRLLHQAVQLNCLHNCCQQCFSTATLTASSNGISCDACGFMTQVGCEQHNSFVDGLVQGYRLITESRVCGICKDNGEHDKPALSWCETCLQALCGDCIVGHKKYNKQHVTQSLEHLKSPCAVLKLPTASVCAIHKKSLDVVCLNCDKAKCITCWAECKLKSHEMHVVTDKLFDIHIGKVINSLASIENELLQKSEILSRPKSMLRDTKAARDRHLEEINVRKRRVVDAVELVFQEIEFFTKNVYDDLEAEGNAAAAVADRIDAELSGVCNYVRRLLESDQKCEILNQQKIVQARLSALSAELDSLSEHLNTTKKEVKIEATLPDSLEDVIRAWIGMPRAYAALSSHPTPQQKQQQSISFCAASARFVLPVPGCWDVALTPDGRSLLLSAWECGLIELSTESGLELRRWQPPSCQWDAVQAVTALSDRRAAVSLRFSKHVVLLRRQRKSCSSTINAGAAEAAGDYAWTEYRRLQLQLIPWWLSAHGDLLAVASCNHQLELLSLSSEQQLSLALLKCKYEIGCVAVTERAVVIGSRLKVELGGGHRAVQVLDAVRVGAHGGKQKRLWRHRLLCSGSSDSKKVEEEEVEERLHGICADSSCLYAAVCRSDRSSGHVSVMSMADGNELRRVVLSFCSGATAAALQQVLLPTRLSLCDDRAADEQQGSSGSCTGCRVVLLAVLCRDRANVTLHRLEKV